ncbi:hypothetical protein [Pseudomonas phage PA1C]|nr:hypothetical protein [Pseudomonas phage PA1C]
MNSLAQETSKAVVFSQPVSERLVEYLKALPRARWYNRKKINSIPTKGTVEANYWFLGNGQMPKELSDYLFEIAPTINGIKPKEACVNMYEVGFGMPEHIDIAMYRFNVVIALCDNGDGLDLNGEFIPDVPGRAVIFPAKTPPHSVPPVKHLRFVLIYLYE